MVLISPELAWLKKQGALLLPPRKSNAPVDSKRCYPPGEGDEEGATQVG